VCARLRHEVRPLPTRTFQVRRGRAATIALVAGVAYVLLTLLVMAHLTGTLDVTVREWFRPDDVWGALQVRVDVVVEGLKPSRVALVLPLVAVSAGLVQRSWRPVVVALEVTLLTIVVVMGTKLLVGRTDPHGDMTTVGGSFPSGHTAVLLAVLGGCLLAVTRRVAWWAWGAVAMVDLLMAWCLLVQGAHWFTDVLGGMLAATCVLAAVAASRSPPAGSNSLDTSLPES
jgi:membrane-associated phospholipid phosphatase